MKLSAILGQNHFGIWHRLPGGILYDSCDCGLGQAADWHKNKSVGIVNRILVNKQLLNSIFIVIRGTFDV